MSKDKFDLSNVGGQPKDWMQREHEKQVASSEWESLWIPAAIFGTPLLLIASAALALYGFFK